MTATRPWLLVLGASSGFGAATARAFAERGFNVAGVHLDRRGRQAEVDELVDQLRGLGAEVRFYNRNAADDTARQEIIEDLGGLLHETGSRIQVVLHSLAFGTLTELVTDEGEGIRRRQLDMTLDVMANSLVYWVQGLVGADLLGRARIFALTSTGAHSAWASYGAVSAAKAALESYVRQLCLELAPRGVTVNAILAGVTPTAALSKIPNSENIVAKAISKNPHNRLTRPEDVAACLVELSRPGTYWMTGNIIRVDGGEDFCA